MGNTETKKSNPIGKFGKKTATAVADKPPPVQKKFSFPSFGKKNDADTVVAKKAPIKKILVKEAVAKKEVAKKAPIKKVVVAKKAANPLAYKKPAKVKKVVAKKVLPAKKVVPKKPRKKIVKKPVSKFKN